MLDDFILSSTSLTLFVAVSWLCCFMTTLVFAYLFVHKRYIFIKPSVLLLVYSYIFFQWPSVIYAGYYETFLPNPYIILLIVNSYILIGLFVCSCVLSKDAKLLWNRLTDKDYMSVAANPTGIIFLVVVIAIVTGVYLHYVPLSSTGLYAIIYDPSASDMAREESLKLIQNKVVAYSYSMMTSSAAPLLVSMSLIYAINQWRKHLMLKWLLPIFIIVGTMSVVSLTGARVSAVNLILIMVMTVFLNNGLPLKPLRILFIGLVVLLPAVLISIFREGNSGFDLTMLLEFFGYIATRVFILPLDVGSWYIHHAQTNGVFGLAAVPKLAFIFGEPTFDITNFIASHYRMRFTDTSSAMGGYIFSYYGYFGIISVVISLFGLWLLDVAVLVYKKLSNKLLLPTVASISVAVLSFISTDYSIVWVTHGFGVILLLALILDKLCKGNVNVMRDKKYNANNDEDK